MTEPTVQDHLPLSPGVYRVLLALGDQVLHGYGIIEAFEALTDGQETLLAGTLYATLSRMSEAGLVVRVRSPQGERSGGPERRYYRVTEFGMEVARAESARLSRLLNLARSRGLTPEFGG